MKFLRYFFSFLLLATPGMALAAAMATARGPFPMQEGHSRSDKAFTIHLRNATNTRNFALIVPGCAVKQCDLVASTQGMMSMARSRTRAEESRTQELIFDAPFTTNGVDRGLLEANHVAWMGYLREFYSNGERFTGATKATMSNLPCVTFIALYNMTFTLGAQSCCDALLRLLPKVFANEIQRTRSCECFKVLDKLAVINAPGGAQKHMNKILKDCLTVLPARIDFGRSITSLAWNNAENMFVVGLKNAEVRLFNGADRSWRSLPVSNAIKVAWSCDGRYVYALANNRLHIFNGAVGFRPIRAIDNVLNFHPDQKRPHIVLLNEDNRLLQASDRAIQYDVLTRVRQEIVFLDQFDRIKMEDMLNVGEFASEVIKALGVDELGREYVTSPFPDFRRVKVHNYAPDGRERRLECYIHGRCIDGRWVELRAVHTHNIRRAVWNAKGMLATADTSGTICVWPEDMWVEDQARPGWSRCEPTRFALEREQNLTMVAWGQADHLLCVGTERGRLYLYQLPVYITNIINDMADTGKVQQLLILCILEELKKLANGKIPHELSSHVVALFEQYEFSQLYRQQLALFYGIPQPEQKFDQLKYYDAEKIQKLMVWGIIGATCFLTAWLLFLHKRSKQALAHTR